MKNHFKLKLIWGDSPKDSECRYLLQEFKIDDKPNKQRFMDSVDVCLTKIRQRLEYEIDLEINQLEN